MSRITKNEEILKRLKEGKSISLLLGAGFSAPIGYPIGNQLNTKLLNCMGDDFAFSSAGELCICKDGAKPDLGYKNSYDWYFDFCKDVIHYYNDNVKTFDYEEFYDYLKEVAKNDKGLKELFEKGNYSKSEFENFDRYVSQIDNIYNQIVAFYLEDETGKSWYDDEPTHLKPTFDGYTGFLNCIEELSKNHIVNVHTLNHDLFFERLNRTEWINGELCDGFEELGSPFYGELLHKNRTYKCRLSKYTGKYKKKIRLYKLHGSKDYFVYHTNKDAILYPETFIKSRWGIDTTAFRKEIKKKGGVIEYETDFINYHPNFLTGTTSKISRYQEPLLYKKIFELFKENLNKAEILIIIGYGCKDLEINRYILEEFGTEKPCFIIDPFTDNTEKLGVNAKWIKKAIENLLLSDFNL
ncbi:MAG: hypothetical protein FWH18_04230 [Marinilabiliaceae bacterium]|nr:hypothetical protein [Marinilabiliaceae bacterium]